MNTTINVNWKPFEMDEPAEALILVNKGIVTKALEECAAKGYTPSRTAEYVYDKVYDKLDSTIDKYVDKDAVVYTLASYGLTCEIADEIRVRIRKLVDDNYPVDPSLFYSNLAKKPTQKKKQTCHGASCKCRSCAAKRKKTAAPKKRSASGTGKKR